MMLVESTTDSEFQVPSESELTEKLLDFLYKSASRKSIVSKAMCKLLTEWILSKIQTKEACKVRQI